MTDPATMRERTVGVNGVRLQVHDAGAGPPVVLAHGFPELAYSWRHQISALAQAGYRVLAPDQRGYGRSERPPGVEDYDIVALTDDLVGLLDAIDAPSAVFVGHDWGALVVWALAQRAPQRVAGIVALSVAFVPRRDVRPTELLRSAFGDDFYILRFQEPGVVDRQLAADVGATFRATFAGLGGPQPAGFGHLGDPVAATAHQPLPAWLTSEEFDHYVEAFTRTGFTGALNWYRNFDRNWELSAEWAHRKIHAPALFIAGAVDPVLDMAPPDGMRDWVIDLRGLLFVDGAGHWIQQERPNEVNHALVEFLATIDDPRWRRP
jgi:pimeloyl-ACP methyl ester carboxylesterase